MRRIAGVTLALSLALALALGVGATESDTTIRLAVRNATSLPSPQAWTSIEVPQRGSLAATMAATAAELGAEVLPDLRYDLFAPQDEPLFGNQWHHHNTGQSGGTVDADIDSPTAWPVSLGSGVVVAVIDSGVWEGMTSQGEDFLLVVEGRALSMVSLGFEDPICPEDSPMGIQYGSPRHYLVGNTLAFVEGGADPHRRIPR